MSLKQRLVRLEYAALDNEVPEASYIAIWPIAGDHGAEEARMRVQTEINAARAIGRRVIEVNTVDAS